MTHFVNASRTNPLLDGKAPAAGATAPAVPADLPLHRDSPPFRSEQSAPIRERPRPADETADTFALPPGTPAPAGRRYCLITPCRDEARYAETTLASVAAQTQPPALWIIVDDGSSDETPQILERWRQKLPYLRVIHRTDRGERRLGAGVIEAFYDGFDRIDPEQFDYVCKLDLDLDLPPRYFERAMEIMEDDERLANISGKPYFRRRGGLVSEQCGDENAVGMVKFYRVEAFKQIGGFVREVMWDGIDGHRCRMLGWRAESRADPELSFIHLRPMGTSHRSWWTGRARHGRGQYFMGTGPLYMLASATYRMSRPPRVVGGVAMLWGYIRSAVRGERRYDDPQFRAFLKRYHRMCLMMGKRRATVRLDAQQAAAFQAGRAVRPDG